MVASARKASAFYVHDAHLWVIDALMGKVPISRADEVIVDVDHSHSADFVCAQYAEPDLHGIFGWTLGRCVIYAAASWHL